MRIQLHFLAVVAMVLSLQIFAAESELPAGAIGRLGAHRFVHGDRVRRLGFLAEDRRIFSQSDDGTFCIWDINSGKKVWKPAKKTKRSLMVAQISADGTVVVVAANGKEIGVMKVADPTAIRWMNGAKDRSTDLAVASDGRIAATCDSPNILIWNTARGGIERRLHADEFLHAVALSANGRLVAGGGKSNTRLWQVRDGKQIREWVGSPYTLCFSPDARFLSISMSLRLSDTQTRDSLRMFTLPEGRERWAVDGGFNQVVYSPDGTKLAAAKHEGVTIFAASSGKVLHRIDYTGNQHVYAVAFSHDGKMLATGGDDARVRLWRTSNWSEISRGIGHEGPVECLAFSPDGRTLATGGLDQSIRLWAWRDGREILTIPKIGQHWGIEKVAFSPDGAKLASLAHVNFGDRISIWKVASGEKLLSLGTNCGGGLVFMPDSRELLTGMLDGSMALWNLDTGGMVRQIGKWKDDILDLVMLPGSKQVAWIGDSQGLGIRDLRTGADVKLFAGESPHSDSHITVAPDGLWLVVDYLVWDAVSGEILLENSNINDNVPTAISPDGRLLAWASDNRIHIWERLTRQQIHSFGPTLGRIHDLAFSLDGMTLASAGHDGSVLLWDVTDGLSSVVTANFATLWDQLGGNDHWAAHRAAWTLARAGTAAVEWLEQKLQPAKAPNDGELERLRAQFKSPDFEVREHAACSLLDMGFSLSPAEIKALRRPDPWAVAAAVNVLPLYDLDKTSNISRKNSDLLSDKLLGPPPKLFPLPDRRRSARAIKALEYSDTRNAIQLLERLAGGWPSHPQTKEAKSVLVRKARNKGSIGVTH